MSRPLVTLTTDFGTRDSYVAQMKGVLLSINPDAAVIDVTHDVPPQDILRAAAILEEVAGTFPAGTLHVAVVDPGVGSPRAIVGAEMGGRRFIAPDNGLLALLARRHPLQRVVALTRRQFWRDPVSATFHGRDIMAPVAAHWSLGRDLAEFGELHNGPLVDLPLPATVAIDGGLAGCVLWADAFGNLVTSLRREDLPAARMDTAVVEIAGRRIGALARCYSDAADGALIALLGSGDRLEIAVTGGSAAARLAAGPGTPVRVLTGPPPPDAGAPA